MTESEREMEASSIEGGRTDSAQLSLEGSAGSFRREEEEKQAAETAAETSSSDSHPSSRDSCYPSFQDSTSGDAMPTSVLVGIIPPAHDRSARPLGLIDRLDAASSSVDSVRELSGLAQDLADARTERDCAYDRMRELEATNDDKSERIEELTAEKEALESELRQLSAEHDAEASKARALHQRDAQKLEAAAVEAERLEEAVRDADTEKDKALDELDAVADRAADPHDCVEVRTLALERDVRRLRSLHGPHHPKVAEALTTVALFHQHVRTDLDAALEWHGRALKAYRAATAEARARACRADGGKGESCDDGHEIEIAVALTDIGDVHRRRGSTALAMGAYREALSIFRGEDDRGIAGFDPRAAADVGGSRRTAMRTSESHPGVRAAERGVKLLESRC